MRRTLTAALLLITLAACGDGEGKAGAYIRASFDGGTWSAAATEGEIAYYVESGTGGIATIASRQIGAGSKFIALSLPLPPDLGVHALDGVVARATFASCPNDILADCISWTAVAEHPGTLTIDQVDPTTGLIEGDFAFTGYALGDPKGAAKAFTAGHFRIYAPSVFILQ